MSTFIEVVDKLIDKCNEAQMKTLNYEHDTYNMILEILLWEEYTKHGNGD